MVRIWITQIQILKVGLGAFIEFFEGRFGFLSSQGFKNFVWNFFMRTASAMPKFIMWKTGEIAQGPKKVDWLQVLC